MKILNDIFTRKNIQTSNILKCTKIKLSIVPNKKICYTLNMKQKNISIKNKEVVIH